MTAPARRPRTGWSFWWWTAGAAAGSALLRARFWFTPLTPDEAGATLAARGWAQGHGLYTDLFIDRPQGFIVAYQRAEAWLGSGSTSVRMLGTLAGVVIVIATALAARELGRSTSAGVAGAVLAATFCSSPALEGHTANAELLAAAAGATAVALAAPMVNRPVPVTQMALAGLAAGLAVTIKQSAFDVAAALLGWLVVAGWLRWRPRREVAAAAAALVAGAAATTLAAMTHGASLGWEDYRYALFDFRWEVRSTVSGARWSRLALTAVIAMTLVAPAVWLGVRHLREVRRPWRWTLGPGPALVLAWGALGAVGLLAGGNYHRHYWIQLVPALSVGLALAFTAGRRRFDDRPSPALIGRLAAAVALPLAITMVVIASPPLEQSARLDTDLAVAAWYLDHRTDPDETLLVLCAGAVTYTAAGVAPPYPYLWVDHVRSARQAQADLRDLLGGSNRPTYVAVQDHLDRCDPNGVADAILKRWYQPAVTIDDVTIWSLAPL